MVAEAGHFAGYGYQAQDGSEHLGGGNLYDGSENVIAQKVTFTPAAGAANVTNITIQVTDAAGLPIAAAFLVEWWLSDVATVAALTAITASGAVGAGAAGTDMYGKVSKKAGEGLTDATGKYILQIIDTAKTLFFVGAQCPGTGVTWASAQLVAGNYG